jgi:3-dehydroquinate dehydratase-2
MHLLVAHGPNLNLFGRREPTIYGRVTLDDINARLEMLANQWGASLRIIQSNHEGVLIDAFHQEIDAAQGALINAGALTHTSVALYDCIKAMPFPVIEVHMSNIYAREAFRHHSMIAAACRGSVAGFGWRSYTAALRLLVDTLNDGG